MDKDKNFIKEEKLDPTKLVASPRKYEIKTEPVKDVEGRIVEPGVYIDAESFEARAARAWSNLTPEQKVAFYLEMEQKAALNNEPELTGGMHK